MIFYRCSQNKYKRKKRENHSWKPPKGGDMSGIVGTRSPNRWFCCLGMKHRFVLSPRRYKGLFPFTYPIVAGFGFVVGWKNAIGPAWPRLVK